MDPGVHYVKKALENPSISMPEEGALDHLPWTQGRPIMMSGEEMLTDMQAAARIGSKAFWLADPVHGYLSIKPSTGDIYLPPSTQDAADVEQVVRRYKSYQNTYGNGFALVRWGPPLDLEAFYRSQRGAPSLKDYPRFASNSGTREQMIEALRRYGRFRLYKKLPDGSRKAYKVKLEREAPSARTSPLRLSVDELTAEERLQEELYSMMRKIRLPV
ncbi:hypothetical protein EX895_001185 [Sporisorium graminicola]|uniref:Uncharacterized protein n=1 Tax=Sporisorium graminicola TaxID=280036 RepID=A0A4U7L252_9BASI|nr:hypothetical protein EX895_001185 [Sporisorium graminicola]TKY89888.1 hypothetical protein EX895_001185 [Sporisorium graminicola]